MKERPILFSGPMVRAILDGKKTQTRRVMKPQPWRAVTGSWFWSRGEKHHVWSERPFAHIGQDCPHGQEGDRLWVRESFLIDHTAYIQGRLPKVEPEDYDRERQLLYRADGTCCQQLGECECNGKNNFRPSIFMPRWASRLNLEVAKVRVERVQDISEADAEAEGIDFIRHYPDADETLSAKKLFEFLWDSINGKREKGKYAWELNPWVWATTFKVLPGRGNGKS